MTNPPPIQPSQSKLPWMAMASVFMVVFLVTLTLAVVVTFILPESYASTVRIKLDLDPAKSEPAFLMKTEASVVTSEAVLTNVVRKLQLNELFGKKYFNGEMLRTMESVKILQGRVSAAPIPASRLLVITSYSDDRMEAAEIANATAEAYRDFCAGSKTAQPSGAVDAGEASAITVTILDNAEPGNRPVKPNKPLNITLGAIFGVILGSIAAMVIGFLLPLLSRGTLKYRPSGSR